MTQGNADTPEGVSHQWVVLDGFSNVYGPFGNAVDACKWGDTRWPNQDDWEIVSLMSPDAQHP